MEGKKGCGVREGNAEVAEMCQREYERSNSQKEIALGERGEGSRDRTQSIMVRLTFPGKQKHLFFYGKKEDTDNMNVDGCSFIGVLIMFGFAYFYSKVNMRVLLKCVKKRVLEIWREKL